jgi:SAM-dependent methyltransferase
MNPAELANIAASEESFWWYRGMREILHSQLDRFTAGMDIQTVLDAGCGTGANACHLHRRYGWRVIALDANPAAIAFLRRRGLPAVLGDAAGIPLASGSCDAAVCLDVLIHLEPGRESDAFAEFARVLRPGGLLVLRAAAFNWLRSRHSIFIEERQRFTRPQIVRLARSSGLTPLSALYLNGLALPLAFAKFRLWEPLFASRPESAVTGLPSWLDALLLAGLRTELSLLRRGIQLPAGQSILLIAQKPAAPPPAYPAPM